MSIIKNKDIYDPSQGDPFAPITKGLDMLDNKIEETKKKMVGLEKTINIGDTSGAQVKELIANIQKLEAEISKLKDTQAAKANIEKQLAYAQEKYNALQTETAAKLAEVKVETQAYNKQLMDNAKLASNTVQAVQKHRIELRELKSTLLTVNKGTKEYNDAMKRAAQITDDLSDMQEKIKGSAMDLEGVMGNVHKVTTGVASGFEIAQGMAALFGSENENLAKALVKVQATMAIAQGLQGLDGMGKAFGRLMLQIRIFAQGVNKALLSTGIGAFLLLIGAIIANWDKVKEAISGVSSETKKLSVEAQKNLEIEQAKTRALEDSENLLRMQGYTEKQILNLKLAQLKTDIEAAETGGHHRAGVGGWEQVRQERREDRGRCCGRRGLRGRGPSRSGRGYNDGAGPVHRGCGEDTGDRRRRHRRRAGLRGGAVARRGGHSDGHSLQGDAGMYRPSEVQRDARQCHLE